MFCKNCGKQLDSSTKFCPDCGTPVEAGSSESTVASTESYVSKSHDSEKSRGIAAWLCGFFGFLGLHYFYLGRKSLGIAQIISSIFGVGFVWAFVYFFIILCGGAKDCDGKKVVDWSINPYGEKTETKKGSYFDGTVSQEIMWRLLGFVVNILTCGFGFAIQYCWYKSWHTHHTVVDGRRLKYVGKPGKLFLMCFISALLTIVTLGIYAFYFPIKLIKWDRQHTFFEDEVPESENVIENKNNEISYFDGGFWQLFGWSLLAGLINIFTFGIGLPWAVTIILNWQTSHTVYNKKKLNFKGKGFSLFKNWIVWGLLAIVTLGIYGFWIPVKLYKWIAENTFTGYTVTENTVAENKETEVTEVKEKTPISPLTILGIVSLVTLGLYTLFKLYNLITCMMSSKIMRHFRLIGMPWFCNVPYISSVIIPFVLIALLLLVIFCKKNIVNRISKSVLLVLFVTFMFVTFQSYISRFSPVRLNKLQLPLNVRQWVSIVLSVIGSICGIVYVILSAFKDKPTKIELFSLIGAVLVVSAFYGSIGIAQAVRVKKAREERVIQQKEWEEKSRVAREERAKMEKMHDAYKPFTYDSSSHLVEKLSSGTYEYKAINLASATDNLPWVPADCSQTKGIGEKIILKGQADPHLQLKKNNGYNDKNNPDYYEKNCRAKRIRVTVLENGKSSIIDLNDTGSAQYFSIGDLFDPDSTEMCTIELEIIDVYLGIKYRDLCIDAIQYYFEELPAIKDY